MGHTLGTASKATGMSRTAILRAIGKGKISAQKNEHGEWDIDPAELHRLYPHKAADTGASNGNAPEPDNIASIIENREMKAKLEAAEQRLRDKDSVIDDLRRRLDAEGEERRKLTAILTDQRTKAPEAITAETSTPPAPGNAPPEALASAKAPVVLKPPPAPKKKSWLGWLTG